MSFLDINQAKSASTSSKSVKGTKTKSDPVKGNPKKAPGRSSGVIPEHILADMQKALEEERKTLESVLVELEVGPTTQELVNSALDGLIIFTDITFFTNRFGVSFTRNPVNVPTLKRYGRKSEPKRKSKLIGNGRAEVLGEKIKDRPFLPLPPAPGSIVPVHQHCLHHLQNSNAPSKCHNIQNCKKG